MSVPQVKDRPTSGLRAVFAGIGSLLSGKDKKDKRVKPAAEAPAAAAAPAPTATAPDTTAPETTAEPEAVVVPEAVAVTETAAAPATAQPAAEAVAEAVAKPEPEAAAKPATTAELPLANYDELTVASLRARLRNLSNDDLGQLRAYEEAHQNRPEVIKMFQNRLIKMTSSMPKLEA